MRDINLSKISLDNIYITLDTIDSDELKIRFINEKLKTIDNYIKIYFIDDNNYPRSIPEFNQVKKRLGKEGKLDLAYKIILFRDRRILNKRKKEIINKKSFDCRYNWLGTEKQLRVLGNELVKNEFILTEAEKFFMDNFIYKGDNSDNAKHSKEINWLKRISHLGYLIDKLINPYVTKNETKKALMDSKQIWKKTNCIFLDNNDKPIRIGSKNAIQASPAGVIGKHLEYLINKVYNDV